MINKNIISSGQILNKGLANIKGGGPGGGNEAENKKTILSEIKSCWLFRRSICWYHGKYFTRI
jgi:hypothetical protein